MSKSIVTLHALLGIFLASCGNSKVDLSASPILQFYLNAKFTALLENTLIVESAGADPLKFRLSGHGFTADIPLDTEMPVQPLTNLRYSEVGDYVANVEFFKGDGTPLLQDTVKWSYSLENPNKPIVGFANAATNDPHVVLLVSESRDPQTIEIWIEGDIADPAIPQGSWRPIPKTSQVPIQLSDRDGLKTLKVKMRNAFKNETAFTQAQIILKTKGPENCKVELRGSGANTIFYEMRVTADNEGPLYYRVFGENIESNGFQEFSVASRVLVKLKNAIGIQRFTLQMRDAAENFCLTQEISVNYDPAYQPEGIRIKDRLSWTESQIVTVEPWADHLSDDNVEMYIHGDVQIDAHTFKWIPWQKEVPVSLQPADGLRWVRVQFRVSGTLSSFRYTPIFLKPGIIVQGGASPYRVIASSLLNIDKITLRGCGEAYELQPYASFYSCTPAASRLELQYWLTDGSSIIRSADAPP